MAVNKVVFGGETVVDLTMDTVTPATLAKGITAHDKTGAAIVGTMAAAPEPVARKEANFVDYDGTVIDAYTLEEANRGLAGRPKFPSHDGLIFQNYNLNRSEIIGLTTPTDIGAIYTTEDGSTRLHIHIANAALRDVSLLLLQSVGNGFGVQWGDGGRSIAPGSAGRVSVQHTYASAGDYTITIDVSDSCVLGLGYNMASHCLLGSASQGNSARLGVLRGVHIGKNVPQINNYAFQGCCALETVTIPTTCTYIGESAFAGCVSLRNVNIPAECSDPGEGAFANCSSLRSVTIPRRCDLLGLGMFRGCASLVNLSVICEISQMSDAMFNGCRSLSSITVPASCSDIGATVFAGCYGVREYHFLSESPPALYDSNAFEGIASGCVIYVPKGSLTAYQAATNWSAYASHMREEST